MFCQKAHPNCTACPLAPQCDYAKSKGPRLQPQPQPPAVPRQQQPQRPEGAPPAVPRQLQPQRPEGASAEPPASGFGVAQPSVAVARGEGPRQQNRASQQNRARGGAVETDLADSYRRLAQGLQSGAVGVGRRASPENDGAATGRRSPAVEPPPVIHISDSLTTRHRGRRRPARSQRMAHLKGLASLLSAAPSSDPSQEDTSLPQATRSTRSGSGSGSGGPGSGAGTRTGSEGPGSLRLGGVKRPRESPEGGMATAEERLLSLPAKRQRGQQPILQGGVLLGGTAQRPLVQPPEMAARNAAAPPADSAGVKRSAAVMARWLSNAPTPPSPQQIERSKRHGTVRAGGGNSAIGATAAGDVIPIDVSDDDDDGGLEVICLDTGPDDTLVSTSSAVTPSRPPAPDGLQRQAAAPSPVTPYSRSYQRLEQAAAAVDVEMPTPSQAAEATTRRPSSILLDSHLPSLAPPALQETVARLPSTEEAAPQLIAPPVQVEALSTSPGVDHVERVIQVLKVG